MMMRRRPLLRAAAVGGSAYLVGKRAGQKQADQPQDESGNQSSGGQSSGGQSSGTGSQGGQAEAAQAAASIPDQLNRLSALHDQGSLTDAEFASAKAKLLGT